MVMRKGSSRSQYLSRNPFHQPQMPLLSYFDDADACSSICGGKMGAILLQAACKWDWVHYGTSTHFAQHRKHDTRIFTSAKINAPNSR